MTSLPRITAGALCVLTLASEGAGREMMAPACPGPGSPAALARYLSGEDGSFRWAVVAERGDAGGRLTELRVVSQSWKGGEWTHHLLLYVPVSSPELALLVLRDGVPGERDGDALRTISRATGAASAYLYGIPNQPLFDGREEDALLAHSYSEYLRTGDESWPLLFPMAKAAARALDAVQEASGRGDGRAVERFVIAGHSKRGHAAWLLGAADPRVAGILPIAIDVLNSTAQIAHHREVAGEIRGSSTLFDETIRAADSPAGRCLIEMIDPFSYRADLSEPKLLVLATNDGYTLTDALNLYWSDLPGEKSVLYLPNTSHPGANSHPDVNAAAFAFVRGVATGTPLPQVESRLHVDGIAAKLRVSVDAAARSATIWTSASTGRDLREARWEARPMRPEPGSGGPGGAAFVGEVALPAIGYTGVFAEVELETGGSPFKLSTQIRIVEAGGAGEP